MIQFKTRMGVNEFMMRKIAIFLTSAFLLMTLFFVGVSYTKPVVQATYGHPYPPTPTHRPSPTHTPYPTHTPTPTPTVSITPTPTPEDPCENQELSKDEVVEDCVTPTETPAPPVNQGGPGDGRSDGRSDGMGGHNEPVCSGVYPDFPLLLHFKRVSPTEVELGWWKVNNADHYSLVYGYYGEAMVHGVVFLNSDVTRFTIGNLRPNTPINAQLWAWNGQCVSRSATIDP